MYGLYKAVNNCELLQKRVLRQMRQKLMKMKILFKCQFHPISFIMNSGKLWTKRKIYLFVVS